MLKNNETNRNRAAMTAHRAAGTIQASFNLFKGP
jgi:hypothetical protein